MSEPYYSDGLVSLYLGEWEDVLPSIGMPQVDLVVLDPPYGVTNLDWDRWNPALPAAMAAVSSRMWCWGTLRMFLDRRDDFTSLWRYSQDVIAADVVWEKHNGSNLAADRFSCVHEHATYWYRGAWDAAHEDVPVTDDATARTVRKKARPQQWTGATGPNLYISEDGGPRLKRSVIYARSLHGRAINETQKPVPVLEDLISYGCPDGGIVLDPSAGSCSTAIAARNLGRRSIVIEKREDQCEKAALWLSNAVLDLVGAS